MVLSPDEFESLVGEIMADEMPLQIEITIKSAWLIVSLLQLASRHQVGS